MIVILLGKEHAGKGTRCAATPHIDIRVRAFAHEQPSYKPLLLVTYSQHLHIKKNKDIRVIILFQQESRH
jgi:hypothetical protein